MWGTWELVKNRALQDKLRAEIREQERKKRSRGEEHWLAKDFDEMPYLGAVVKVETFLRRLQTCADWTYTGNAQSAPHRTYSVQTGDAG